MAEVEFKFPFEDIPILNKRLKDHFGLINNNPRFRLTWPNDEFEHRKTNITPEGFRLTNPQVLRMRKYQKYIWEHWVLERLMDVPITNIVDLPSTALSYEPVHVFYTHKPAWVPVKFLVENLLYAMENKGITRYKHPEEGLKTPDLIEKKMAEIDEIERYLFGDESKVGDALHHKDGIAMPKNYEKGMQS